MNKHEKLLAKIFSGKSDANISFDALCRLLVHLRFEERVDGNHHIFVKDDIHEMLNIQRDGKDAKPYQVRQIRTILKKYRLQGNGNV